MNKKGILGILATLSLASLALMSVEANADENWDSATHMGTGGKISFYEVNRPNPGPFSKNLTLAWVPELFDFGNNKVDKSQLNAAATYSQVNVEPGVKQFVSVSDDRYQDERTGWTLKASLDDFVETGEFKKEDPTDPEIPEEPEVPEESETRDGTAPKVLENAVLKFNMGKLQQYNIDIKDSDRKNTASPSINSTGAVTDLPTAWEGFYTLPELTKPVALTANTKEGAAIEVMKYATEEHLDVTQAVASEISNVTLKVLDHQNVADKTFTSTLHWTLSTDVTP